VHYTRDDVGTWLQSEDRRIYLGDVLDKSNSDTMGVGFARYAPGEANPWRVTYDEALIITDGSFTVTPTDGPAVTAGPGELIFLKNGTELVYSAGSAGADLVYVSYPAWSDVTAPYSDQFHPIDGEPERTAKPGNLEQMRRIWGPFERGESYDMQPFWDILAEDVVLTTSVGEVRGKSAIQNYFATAAETIDFNPFVKPLEYFDSGDGERVAIAGDETFTVKETRASHRAEWVWLMDMHKGLVTRITAIQDVSPIADHIAGAITAAGTA
jgi:ethanolamine utilization protein EutQ